MVFPFFKKSEKMPERAAARPRVALPEMKLAARVDEVPAPLTEPMPDLEFTRTDITPPQPAPPPAASAREAPPVASPAVAASASPHADDDLDFTGDAFGPDFSESSVMAIDVAHDCDPLQGDIEQVVVLFANGQDAAARSLLESCARSYSGVEGRRLWLLLFDLLQVTGDRAAYDKFCVEFAQTCEMSPPAWRERVAVQAPARPGGPFRFVLQGVVTTENAALLGEIDRLLQGREALVIDCGKLVGCDDTTADFLAERLSKARRAGRQVSLAGVDNFLQRLEARLLVGEPAHEPAWRLLLELLQREGTEAVFEERAVDYAITFERSPPSWETVAGRLPGNVSAKPDAAADDAFFLVGELKNRRFEELTPLLESQAQPVIDFSGVSRMDFLSAGQLVNRLAPFKAAGKEIIIRSPNHLVAELMAVVGLNKQAHIIVPKS